jgi:hypothetical protein
MPWGDDETELRVLTHKMMGKLIPLSEAAAVPEAVALAVMHALEVEPGDRPGSCMALVHALERP